MIIKTCTKDNNEKEAEYIYNKVKNNKGDSVNGENSGNEVVGAKENGQIESNGSNEFSQVDNGEKPEPSDVSAIQGSNEQILSHGNAASGKLESNGNSGTDTANTNSVSRNESDKVSTNEITTGNGPVKKSPKPESNNVEKPISDALSKLESNIVVIILKVSMKPIE